MFAVLATQSMVTCNSSLNRLRQGHIWKQRPHQLSEPKEFTIKACSLGIMLLIAEGKKRTLRYQKAATVGSCSQTSAEET